MISASSFLRLTTLTLGLLAGTAALSACSDNNDPAPDASTALPQRAMAQYADLAYYTYLDSRDAAVALRGKLAAFVAAPTAASFAEARAAYLAARTPYEQTEAFRFYGGPIDDEDGPEGQLNGWPMDEAYVDYVVGAPLAGIINQPARYPVISKAALAELNESGSETNISTGYHAIEFLLWGQDLSATGPGTRPYTDYVAGGTAANQVRRGQYLLAVADLLIDDLNQVLDQWKPDQDNYRRAFLKQEPRKALALAFTGLGKFTAGEAYGERMQVAYNTQDQEDEHSCFSDQTHNDFILGQRGISNVYYGRYTRPDGTQLDGPGLDEVVRAASPAADDQLQAALKATTDAVAAIPAPFDQAIISPTGRPKVQAALQAGQQQALRLVEAAKAAGIDIVL